MNQSSKKAAWRILDERSIIESPFMSLFVQDCVSDDTTKRQDFYVLRSRDWCNIIPVTEEGQIVMVRQYRHGAAQNCLEIPGGVIDPEDPQIAKAALRELTEETGYAPTLGARLESLGSCLSNPAILDNRTHSFIVGPVRKVGIQNLDPGEIIDVIELPAQEVVQQLADGTIDHALILHAFFKLQLRQPEKTLEEILRSFSQAQPSFP